MALIDCPKCDGKISTKAKECPKCGLTKANKKSLIKCFECGAVVDKKTKICPECGGPPKKKTSKLTWTVLLFISLFVFAGFFGSEENLSDEKKPVIVAAQEKPAVRQSEQPIKISSIFKNGLYRFKAGDSGKYYVLSAMKLENNSIQVLSSRIGKGNAYTDFTKVKINCSRKQYFVIAGSSEDGAKNKPTKELRDLSKDSKWTSVISGSSKSDLVSFICEQTVLYQKNIDDMKTSENKQKTKNILQQLKYLPASKHKENLDLYRELSSLNPTNIRYKEKITLYQNKLNKSESKNSE